MSVLYYFQLLVQKTNKQTSTHIHLQPIITWKPSKSRHNSRSKAWRNKEESAAASHLDFKDYFCTVYIIFMTLQHNKTEFKRCHDFEGMQGTWFWPVLNVLLYKWMMKMFDPFLTAVPTVCTGDELFGFLVAVLLLGPQTETTNGYGLCHRLREEKQRKRTN